jgi:hypothetical protein
VLVVGKGNQRHDSKRSTIHSQTKALLDHANVTSTDRDGSFEIERKALQGRMNETNWCGALYKYATQKRGQ